MRYQGTRSSGLSLSPAEAIVQGLAPDGGLFVPESIPAVSMDEVVTFAKKGYAHCAATVMARFLADDFTYDELLAMAKEAYANYDSEPPVPLSEISPNESVMELYHGPTLAFKDMALQMLPRLMAASIKKTGQTKNVLILVATSGDTGKAALEGFADVPGTSILVFYPEDGVADMQRLQMVTQKGQNVSVCAVKGNFDDAQSGVKRIFGDASAAEALSQKGFMLSSANSINWGRLVPQIAYYFWAYSTLLSKGAIKAYDKLSFVVPTGNFGDIIAGWYAKRMGLPVGRLVCASNSNKVLTDFFDTGVYDRRREFFKTSSPSMDILISSNLERLLYHATGSTEAVSGFMRALVEDGVYSVGENVLKALRADFDATWCSEYEARAALSAAFENGYLMDTHTAVAQGALDKLAAAGHSVVLSTASPYKFPADVLRAIGKHAPEDGFEAADALNAASGVPVPAQITDLKTAPIRFTASCEKDAMEQALFDAVAAFECGPRE